MTVVTGPARSTCTAVFALGAPPLAGDTPDPDGPEPLAVALIRDGLADLPGVAAREQLGQVAVALLLAGGFDLRGHQVVVARALD